MRLTVVTLGHSVRFFQKQLWLYRGRMKQPVKPRPHFFQRARLEAEDPNTLFTPPPRFPPWEPPVKDDPRFIKATPITEHPDYHEEPIYQFDNETKLLEGLRQTQNLTKTHIVHGLPSSVRDRIETSPSLPDQDDIIQRYIMQAHVWEPTKEKIHRRKLPMTPFLWKFKAESGIPQLKTTQILLRNLLRLCRCLEPELELYQSHDHPVTATYQFNADRCVQILGRHLAVLFSPRPLPPFASPEDLDASVGVELPSLYPVQPTIDLRKNHVYRVDSDQGWRQDAPHLWPHTIVHSFKDEWSEDARATAAMMFCFGHCVAAARRLYGVNTSESSRLPAPVSCQFIGSDGVTFTLMTYQLNTLDTGRSGGVKNICWLSPPRPLFNKVVPKRAMLRNTKYQDCDPSVFPTLFSLYRSPIEQRLADRVQLQI